MIQNNISRAYPTPHSSEMLMDYKQGVTQRIATTQQTIKSTEEKIQKTIDPELTKVFNIGVKTLIDLYA